MKKGQNCVLQVLLGFESIMYIQDWSLGLNYRNRFTEVLGSKQETYNGESKRSIYFTIYEQWPLFIALKSKSTGGHLQKSDSLSYMKATLPLSDYIIFHCVKLFSWPISCLSFIYYWYIKMKYYKMSTVYPTAQSWP